MKFGGSKKFDKDFEKWNLCTRSPARCPEGVTPPPKMVPPYSLGTCPPTTPSHFDGPSLLHRENIDFLKTSDFGQSTQMALESPKINICQNWPKGDLGDVSSCLETKFDKKIPMESVPNCRKEIANRYGIRWFTPPKKEVIQVGSHRFLKPVLWVGGWQRCLPFHHRVGELLNTPESLWSYQCIHFRSH